MKTKKAVESTLEELEAVKQRYEDTDKVSAELDLMRTPLASSKTFKIVNELTAEKGPKIFEKHTSNKKSIFATTLHLLEANKACALIGIQLEFKLYELPEKMVHPKNKDLDTTATHSNDNSRLSMVSSTSSQSRGQQASHCIHAISVLDRENSLITIWSMDKFEQRFSLLRNICEFYMDERDQEGFSSEFIFTSADYLNFMESEREKEWQSYEEFKANDSKFSQDLLVLNIIFFVCSS